MSKKTATPKIEEKTQEEQHRASLYPRNGSRIERNNDTTGQGGDVGDWNGTYRQREDDLDEGAVQVATTSTIRQNYWTGLQQEKARHFRVAQNSKCYLSIGDIRKNSSNQVRLGLGNFARRQLCIPMYHKLSQRFCHGTTEGYRKGKGNGRR